VLLLQAIGPVLPAAMAITLSPFPLMGIVLILGGPRRRLAGPLFALGWVVGLGVVTTLVVVLLDGADDPDSASSAVADWGRVIVGAALIVTGARKWRRRPRGDEAELPGWMASIADASPRRALLLGVLLSGVNPKNIVLTASSAASIVEAGVDEGQLVIAAAVFVLLGSLSVLGALGLQAVGGSDEGSILDTVRRFMGAHSAVITVVILLVLGSSVLGDGLTGLGR
jgi:threonine/homoserine/homoserine lactone efflux protein